MIVVRAGYVSKLNHINWKRICHNTGEFVFVKMIYYRIETRADTRIS